MMGGVRHGVSKKRSSPRDSGTESHVPPTREKSGEGWVAVKSSHRKGEGPGGQPKKRRAESSRQVKKASGTHGDGI